MTAATAPDTTASVETASPGRDAAPAARQWVPGFLALALIWGSSFLFIGVAVRDLHPLYVSLGRVASGAVTILVVLLVVRGRLPRAPRTWGHLAVIGVVGVALPFTLFSYGEQRVSSILAGIWNATTPLVVLPMAALAFGIERMTARRVTGLLVGFAGVLTVLGVWRGVGGTELTGQLMCFGAAVCYGIAIPYQRRFLTGASDSPVGVPAGQLIVATVVLAIVAPVVGGAPPSPAAVPLPALASVLALGVLGTGLAFLLNFRVIRVAGASASASVTYLLPVVATVLGVLVLDEHLSWYQPVGALVVLGGVAISQGVIRWPVRRRARRPSPAVAPPATC
ncbi:MAG TPA: DMT family transporter [Micromonosporaceae bacterium]|nr:DMT family transporter [Micromonosporaceae bacterium]